MKMLNAEMIKQVSGGADVEIIKESPPEVSIEACAYTIIRDKCLIKGTCLPKWWWRFDIPPLALQATPYQRG